MEPEVSNYRVVFICLCLLFSVVPTLRVQVTMSQLHLECEGQSLCYGPSTYHDRDAVQGDPHLFDTR